MTWRAFLTILLFFNCHSRTARGTKAVLHSVWNPLCLLTADLEKLQGRAQESLANDAATVTELTQQLLRAEVYKQIKNSPEIHQKIKPLTAHIANLIQSQQNALHQNVAKDLKHARALAFLQGHIAEFLTVFAAATNKGGTGDAGCLVAEAGASASTTPVKLSEISDMCKLTAANVKTGSENDGNLERFSTAGYSGFTTATSDTGAQGRLLTSGNVKCPLTKPDANNGIIADGTGDLGNNIVYYAGGYLKLSQASKFQAEKITTATAIPPTAKAYKDAHSAYLAENKKRAKSSTLTYDTMTADPVFKHVFDSIVLGKPKVDDSNRQANLTAIYKDATTFNTNILDKIKNEPIPHTAYKEGDGGKTNLGEITDIGELQTILAYYETRNANKVAEKVKRIEAELAAAQANAKVITKTMKEICADIKDPEL
uniref:Variant surface glycoprotein 1343 n=1 Tax=Trypanosoma brucei TaxID=5691 RepID=M4SYA8_9TRYP|nr:variant surface glycoprotein 1343 [Trypanosoma brucei]